MKIHSVGAELSHADGRMEGWTAFHNFANVPETCL